MLFRNTTTANERKTNIRHYAFISLTTFDAELGCKLTVKFLACKTIHRFLWEWGGRMTGPVILFIYRKMEYAYQFRRNIESPGIFLTFALLNIVGKILQRIAASLLGL